MTDRELFDFAVENGIIDASKLRASYKDMEQKKYLEMHFGKNYKLTRGKDGRYFTRLPNGKQLRKSDESLFIEEIVSYYKSVEAPTTFYIKDIYTQWIEFKLKYDGIVRSTYDRMNFAFNRFFVNNEHAQQILNLEFYLITEDDLEFFIRDTILDQKLNAKSWAMMRSLISGIWLYGLKIGATDLYITKFLDLLSIKPKTLQQRVEEESTQVFTDEEVGLVFDEIHSRGYSLTGYGVILCFYTGMRVGEIAGLMWKDVSKDFKTITVNHMEVLYSNEDGVRNHFEVVDHAKTVAGLRRVIVPDAFIPYFKELKEKAESSEYVFVKKGKRLHARNFSDMLYRICIKLNIPPKRMHKVRKTVCSKLCDCGVDDRLLLKQIGHTDRKTTEIFYHRDRRTEAEKRDILNSAVTY